MTKGHYPGVYVVDTHATQPPLPPRLNQWRRQWHASAAQKLLFLLVSLALCGMTIEAFFIFRLYQHESDPAAMSSQLKSQVQTDERVTPPTTRPSFDILPSKPVAHLTDGQDVVHGEEIMAWSINADPLLYEMSYKDGSLFIQKEGFYYVYSKVFFQDFGKFHHSVKLETRLYSGKSITLLTSRKYSIKSNSVQSNSYLGGVFHLYEDDTIFVKVSNTSKVLRHKSYENIFGAFML